MAAPKAKTATAKPAVKGKVKARKKEKKNIAFGHAYIKSTFNNTIISITDPSGAVISWALRAAASAASWAANGVDLRDPLKPTWPDEAQEITAPDGSVIEIIVLLKVLLI